MIELLKVVEIDLGEEQYKMCTAYITSNKHVEKVKLRVKPPPGARVLRSYPYWPKELEEYLEWEIKTYPRKFENGVKYSFGIRLTIDGTPPKLIKVLKWELTEVNENHVKLETILKAPYDFTLIIPFYSKLKPLTINSKNGILKTTLQLPQPVNMLEAIIEAIINDEILPFKVTLTPLKIDKEKYRLLLRKPITVSSK